MGKSEIERKGNFAPSYLSFPVPFRPFQINPAFLSLSEKNGQLSGKGNIAFLSLTCMTYFIHISHSIFFHMILCEMALQKQFNFLIFQHIKQTICLIAQKACWERNSKVVPQWGVTDFFTRREQKKKMS